MDRNMVTRRITDIRKELLKLQNDVCAMDSVDIGRYPKHYEALSTETALRAEKVACRLRSLIYASSNVTKTEYLARAVDVHGVRVAYEEGIMEVVMPRLLPKKKMRQSQLFLLDPLHAALKRYAEKRPLPRFQECVVCMSHVYDRALPEWRMPDYDNLQQKEVLDMVALYVMADDSGRFCDVYHTTEPG